jgi:hypothetical protein
MLSGPIMWLHPCHPNVSTLTYPEVCGRASWPCRDRCVKNLSCSIRRLLACAQAAVQILFRRTENLLLR